MKKLYSLWTSICLGLCLLFGLAAVAAAQSSSVGGKIQGTVVDEHKAPVAGATVTVTRKETGASRTVTSNDSGVFVALQLEPGTYEVTAGKEGFAEVKLTGIRVEVGSSITVNPELKVGQVSGEIVITDATPFIEVAKTEFSNTVTEKDVRDLPINGRRWSNFALLTPGVTLDSNFGLISFRGISGLLNNNTIDGADNNQAFFAEERGRTRISYVISQESVREFQVNTSNYSAEFGRAAGGLVNSVTKSGTNTWHGSAFYFLRDDALNARNPRDFLSNPDGSLTAIKPPERRQQWGGSLSGPIVKDRAFFFISYDQQKRNFPGLVAPSNPNFFDFTTPNNAGGISGCRATATSTLNPNCAPAVAFLREKTGLFSRKGNQEIFYPKVDWNINARNVLTGSYNFMKWHSPSGIQTQPVISVSESANGSDDVRVDILNFKVVSTISSRVLNEARFQWARDFESQFPNAPGPSVSITNGISFGQPNFLPRPAFPNEQRWQYVDNVSWIVGNHTLKFGGDINRVKDFQDNLFNGGGVYSYSNLSTFANDLANPAGKQYSSYQQAFGPPQITFSTVDYNFYAQDEWRVRKNVTLNYGLRYEYESLPDPIANPALPQSGRFNSDTNNFGPRVGVAWDVFGNGNTVVRTGVGMYYGRLINSSIANFLTNTGGAQSQFNFFVSGSNKATVGPVFPNTLSSPPNLTLNPPDVRVLDSNFADPQIYQGDFTVEQALSRNIVVSGSYLVSRGLRLPIFVDKNLPQAAFRATIPVLDEKGNELFRFVEPYFGTTLTTTALARPNTSFGRIIEERSVVQSIYHAMVLQVRQRQWHGLAFNANFTWSRAIDDGQTSTTFTSSFTGAVSPFDLQGERALSTFDARKRFVFFMTYDIPFARNASNPIAKWVFGGWKVNNIVTVQDGPPITGSISGGALGSFRETTTGPLIRNIGGGHNGSGGSNRVPFIGRNSFRMPSRSSWDMRIAKDFHVTERNVFEFIFEAFNLLNTTNFTQVDTVQFFQVTNPVVADRTLRPNVFQPNPNFLRGQLAGNTIFRERQIQFAFRYRF